MDVCGSGWGTGMDRKQDWTCMAEDSARGWMYMAEDREKDWMYVAQDG